MNALIALWKKIRSSSLTQWAPAIGGLLHLVAAVIIVLAGHGWL